MRICNQIIITNELQQIVNMPNWKAGDSVVFIFKYVDHNANNILTFSGNSSSDIKANKQPHLVIKTTSPFRVGGNARKVLNNVVDDILPYGNTPIGETMYVAASYLSQTKHNNIYPPSPIQYKCQKNNIILLTDGVPNSDANTVRSLERRVLDLTGKKSCGNFVWTGQPRFKNSIGRIAELTGCITKFLATTDQHTSLEGDQFITTDAIGFAIEKGTEGQEFLDSIVAKGGGGKIDPATGKPNGKAYLASNANELKDAFTSIISSATNVEQASSSNVSISINASNRAEHSDQVYYPMYAPSITAAWEGNIKRYKLKRVDNALKVFDANGNEAFEANTTNLKSTARSFWSMQADGNNLSSGGVAGNLPNSKLRNRVFSKLDHGITDVKTNLLTAEEYKFTEAGITANGSTFSTILDSAFIPPSKRELLRQYAIGLKDGVNESKSLGDPLNSAPVAVAYSCPSTTANNKCEIVDPITGIAQDNTEGVVIFGTNEGFVHFIDMKTGVEKAAFMPGMLVPNLDKLRKNANGKVYGVDNSVTVWKNDFDQNGYIYKAGENTVTAGETVYAYVTLRRGILLISCFYYFFCLAWCQFGALSVFLLKFYLFVIKFF